MSFHSLLRRNRLYPQPTSHGKRLQVGAMTSLFRLKSWLAGGPPHRPRQAALAGLKEQRARPPSRPDPEAPSASTGNGFPLSKSTPGPALWPCSPALYRQATETSPERPGRARNRGACRVPPRVHDSGTTAERKAAVGGRAPPTTAAPARPALYRGEGRPAHPRRRSN